MTALRVLHIDTEKTWRGGEQQALYLALGLQKRGVEQLCVGRPGRPYVERCAEAGLDAELLLRLARADHLGHTTEEALARRFDAGDAFAARLRALDAQRAVPDLVRGRDLLERGVAPGPRIGEILERCRAVQDETGWTDRDRVLERALSLEALPGDVGADNGREP